MPMLKVKSHSVIWPLLACLFAASHVLATDGERHRVRIRFELKGRPSLYESRGHQGSEEPVVKVVKRDFERLVHEAYFLQVARVESSPEFPPFYTAYVPGHVAITVWYRSDDPDIKPDMTTRKDTKNPTPKKRTTNAKSDIKKSDMKPCGTLVFHDGTPVKSRGAGVGFRADLETGDVEMMCSFGVPKGTSGLRFKIRDYPLIDLGF